MSRVYTLASLDSIADAPPSDTKPLPPVAAMQADSQQRWHRLVTAVMQAEGDAELAEAAERVLQIEPRNAIVLQLLADAWIRLGEPLRAARIAEQTMRLDRYWARPALTRTQALLLARRPEATSDADRYAFTPARPDVIAAAARTRIPGNQETAEMARICESRPDTAARSNCWKSLLTQIPGDLNTSLLALSTATNAIDVDFQQQLITQIRAQTPESSSLWRLARARLLLSDQPNGKKRGRSSSADSRGNKKLA